MKIYKESELEFSFPDDLMFEELDRQGVTLPVGMSLVDLVIENENEILLIEIKDPSNSEAPEQARRHYERRIRGGGLITEELVPKVRDSYTYLHLMERDRKQFKYIVLLCLDAFPNEKALLIGFRDRLMTRILKETDVPWKRRYIQDCAIMTLDIWNDIFKEWQVQRIPLSAATT